MLTSAIAHAILCIAACLWPVIGTPQPPPTLVNFNALDRINIDIKNSKYGKISSLLILQGNRIVYEKYYGFTQSTTLNPISSVTKSITSLAVGICIDMGYIPSVDERIEEYFPEFQNLFQKDSSKRLITLRHLLNQTSGLQWDEWSIHYSYAGNPLMELSQSPINWFEQVLELPMECAPGTKFNYNSGLSEVVKEIICRATGKNFKDFVRDHIFNPLGIFNFYWDTYPLNGEPAWGGINLTTRDMARIGGLILNRGVWANQRVVSERWIEKSFQPSVETPKNSFGLNWWIKWLPHGMPIHFAAGYGDQYLYIIPDLKLVLAMNGRNFTDHKWEKNSDEIYKRVIEAFGQE